MSILAEHAPHTLWWPHGTAACVFGSAKHTMHVVSPPSVDSGTLRRVLRHDGHVPLLPRACRDVDAGARGLRRRGGRGSGRGGIWAWGRCVRGGLKWLNTVFFSSMS